jgi:gluconolactonase
MARILRDAGLSELVESAEVQCLARGFKFTEGPLGFPDGSLLFQDIKAERTYRMNADRSVHPLRERTGAANGQTFGPDGRIIFCEQNGRRVSRMESDGTDVETLVEEWAGGRLNSPNDIVCRSDGIAFFTDPPYGVQPSQRALHFQGVYSLDLRPGATTRGGLVPDLLRDDFEKPNGLAFSPDERRLYVCDTGRYHVRAFDVDPTGSPRAGSGQVFARVDPDVPGGPDGLKVDREGRVYVAVAQGIWVYDPGGGLLGIIALPARPSNLAWWGPAARGLAITAVDSLYYVRLRVEGRLPAFSG